MTNFIGFKFPPLISKHLFIKETKVQFCFKLLICGMEGKRTMRKVECRLAAYARERKYSFLEGSIFPIAKDKVNLKPLV